MKCMYGQAFRAPDVYEMYSTDKTNIKFVQNDHLNPEILKTFELSGNSVITDYLWFEIIGYYNIMNNIIGAVTIPNPNNPLETPPTYTQYQNIGHANSKGINANAILNFKYAKLSLSYTYNLSENEDGEQLANTNHTIFVNSLELKPLKNLNVTVNYFYYDDFSLSKTNIYYPQKLPGFSRFDVVVLYSNFLLKGLGLSFRVDNLTDVDAGYPGARGGSGVFPGRNLFTSRAFYGKLAYSF